MSNERFITIQSVATSGTLPALSRSLVLVTREEVAGFSASANTGLIRVNSTDEASFATLNPTSLGLRNALRVCFGQAYSYSYVYILSAPDGVTSALLDKANRDPRAWSILTLVERYNGGYAGTQYNYFVDLEVLAEWDLSAHKKVCLHTYWLTEGDDLPAKLLLGGSINSDAGFKTIVSDSVSVIDGNDVYDNIAIAWASYCINGPDVSRSWGSLSDAHDFEMVDEDTFSNVTRSAIANNSLAQYNGAKDLAGSLFVYDTQMNSDVNPPDTEQIETVLARYYTEDYTYVLVHNSLQAAGQSGLPNDDAGILTLAGLVRKALNDCYTLNLILSKADLSPDFSVGNLTAAQATVLDPAWKTSGVWPAGVVYAVIKPFGAAHYVTINFAFS